MHKEHFKDRVRNMTMTSREKEALRACILERIDIEHASPIQSPYVSFFRRTHWYSAYALAMILLCIVPTTYATGRSMPGSFLYSIKTDVLEPLEETFAFGNERRTEAVIAHAENRLRETKKMFENNGGTPEQIALVTKNLETKLLKAQEHLIDIPNPKTKIELQSELVIILESYVDILSTDRETGEHASSTEDIIEDAEDVIVSEDEDDTYEPIEPVSSEEQSNAISKEITEAIRELRAHLADTQSDDEIEEIDHGDILEKLDEVLDASNAPNDKR